MRAVSSLMELSYRWLVQGGQVQRPHEIIKKLVERPFGEWSYWLQATNAKPSTFLMNDSTKVRFTQMEIHLNQIRDHSLCADKLLSFEFCGAHLVVWRCERISAEGMKSVCPAGISSTMNIPNRVEMIKLPGAWCCFSAQRRTEVRDVSHCPIWCHLLLTHPRDKQP